MFKGVTGRPVLRRLVALAVATGLILSSIAALPAGTGSACPLPRHSCDQPIFADGCCPGQPAAAPAVTAFAELWSAFSKSHSQLVGWLVEPEGGTRSFAAAFAFDSRVLASGPPPPDRHLSSVLLI